jgi:hypothetical protein
MFAMPRIPFYTQAMKNILAQPTLVRSIQMVNIFSMVFKEVPDDLAKRLSPLTNHKMMHHIFKNFATAILNCSFQKTYLNLMSFETSSIVILSFVDQNDSTKVEEYHEAEQHAQNETLFIYFVCSSTLVLFVLNTIVTLCIAFQGAMSFSPTGKIANSRKKLR